MKHLIRTCILSISACLILLTNPGYSAEQKANEKTDTPKVINKIKDKITGMEFVEVQGGCYQMGDLFDDKVAGKDETPAHEVCLESFYIGKYEVTQAEWSKVTGTVPETEFTGDNLPVQMVSWQDVQKFITTLNEKSGKNYRLPTEAEWEYAARSRGKKEKWAGTSDEKEVDNYAWLSGNSQSKPHPVGQKQPNELGLFDMTGNVWEWVSDWYNEQTYIADSTQSKLQNPKGPSSGKDRAHRGGAFNSDINGSRTTVRSNDDPGQQNSDKGFRLLLPVSR